VRRTRSAHSAGVRERPSQRLGFGNWCNRYCDEGQAIVAEIVTSSRPPSGRGPLRRRKSPVPTRLIVCVRWTRAPASKQF
jgi:hypothetical protein